MIYVKGYLTLLLACAMLNGGFADEPSNAKSEQSDLDQFFRPPPEYAGDFGDYRSPLNFYDGSEVKTTEDWQRRRKEILDRWHRIMGPWPPLIENPKIDYVKTERRERFTQHRVRIEIAADFMFPAILLIPDGKGPYPAAVVPYYDAETGAGLGKELRDFGYQLTKRGFVTLSIGGFKPRRGREDEATIQQLSFEAYGVANCHTALASLPEVDPARIEDRPERWQALNHAIAVNRLLGSTDRVAMTNRKGHSPTPESNERIYLFFQRFLRSERERAEGVE